MKEGIEPLGEPAGLQAADDSHSSLHHPKLAQPEGLEPSTSRVTGEHSDQLNYGC